MKIKSLLGTLALSLGLLASPAAAVPSTVTPMAGECDWPKMVRCRFSP